MRVWIVEDDLTIAKSLVKELERHQLEADYCKNLHQVMEEFTVYQPHLVLLDINLPYQNGYFWCSQIRVQSQVPIIFISSLSDRMDQLMALQMGADDYITKPFDLQLTVLKIQALLRRTYESVDQRMALNDSISYKDLDLSISRASLQRADRTVDLTATEQQILLALFKTPEAFVARDKLLDLCWQNHQYIDDNTLAVNISRLRKKLATIDLEGIIETKKNVGYRLMIEDEEEEEAE